MSLWLSLMRDVAAPFVVGVLALAAIAAAIWIGAPTWTHYAPMPAVIWSQWRLAPFLFGLK